MMVMMLMAMMNVAGVRLLVVMMVMNVNGGRLVVWWMVTWWTVTWWTDVWLDVTLARLMAVVVWMAVMGL